MAYARRRPPKRQELKNGIKLQKSRLEKFANTIDHLQTQGSHLVLWEIII